MAETVAKSSLVEVLQATKIVVADGDPIARFCQPYRQIIRGMTGCSSPLMDLVASFPGLLFALATGYGTVPSRQRCFELVESGAALRDAAAAIGLPFWTRRLPPEAFSQPLDGLPRGTEFGRRVSAHMPAEVWKIAPWFRRVLLGAELAGEEFALWIAWRTKSMPRSRDMSRLVLIGAWAWYSRHPGSFGAELVREPFAPTMSFRRAIEEVDIWRKRIELAAALGEGIADPWYPAGEALGYGFVPLLTIEDFLAEARTMDNCLDQYAMQVRGEASRIYSIRKGEARVGDVEIGPHKDERTTPVIVQLRGPGNRRAPPVLWQATYAWLSQQNYRPLVVLVDGAAQTRTKLVLKRIWEPLLTGIKATPHRASIEAFLKNGELWV